MLSYALRGFFTRVFRPVYDPVMTEAPLDDNDPAFRGTVFGLVVVVIFCATCLAIGVVAGIY
jgi:hypothetical protein